MAKGPTFNDLLNGHQSDLKRVYKMTDRQLEQSVRKHIDGMRPGAEMRGFYEKVYSNKNKR